MIRLLAKIFISLMFFLGITSIASAALSLNYPPTSDFQVVTLRVDCQGKDGCFEDINAAIPWLATNATAATKKMLHIGPGTFNYDGTNTVCNLTGNFTLKGSGRDNTKIALTAAMKFNACPSVVVENLTIERLNGSCTVYTPAILWTDGGSSTWTNVLIDGPNVGWRDIGTTGGTHYWFSSVIRSNNAGDTDICYYNYPYVSETPSDTWIYGGEIVARSTSAALLTRMAGVYAVNGAKIRIFGTPVRVKQQGTKMLGNASNFSFGSFGLVAQGNNSEIHLHGSIVNIASASSSDTCIGIAAYSGGLVHTTGSAFTQNCASGSHVRALESGGTIESPHFWRAGTAPPTSISSVDGQDMFVQTNCASTGCTNVGTQSHLLIYNKSCNTSGPWFDVGLNKCLGE